MSARSAFNQSEDGLLILCEVAEQMEEDEFFSNPLVLDQIDQLEKNHRQANAGDDDFWSNPDVLQELDRAVQKRQKIARPVSPHPHPMQVENLKSLINDKLCRPGLSEWERKFLRDIRDNWLGQNFSERQRIVLGKIFNKKV